MPNNMWLGLMCVSTITVSIGFTCYYVPLVATLVLPWITLATLLTLFYRPTPITIKRIEAPLSSNVISHVSEIINGASTLRASTPAREALVTELYSHIDAFLRIHLTSFECYGWVTTRSHFVSVLIYFLLGLFTVHMRYHVLPGVLVALLIKSYVMMFSVYLVLHASAEVQRGFNCVERLYHYEKDLDTERPQRLEGFNVDKSWPAKGAIEIRNVSMRYRTDLPLSLKDTTLSVHGGEKVGIVGRTGAGKSTLLSVLLGLTDPASGSILIDDIDITKIGVHDLRDALAVIPQDPTLFAGSVRSNLDPRNEKSDEELTRTLCRVGLMHETQSGRSSTSDQQVTDLHKPAKIQRPLTLDMRLSPGGDNLSSGQRQLLSLARAMVRNTRIILIDEATSGVDHETDQRVQVVLREGFRHCTVLAIAHRIGTVRDYDRIVVMDGGSVAEVGSPRDLWDRSGLFYDLCIASGVKRADLRA